MKKTYITSMPNHIGAFLKAIINMLKNGAWQIFGAHGFKKEYTVEK